MIRRLAALMSGTQVVGWSCQSELRTQIAFLVVGCLICMIELHPALRAPFRVRHHSSGDTDHFVSMPSVPDDRRSAKVV